MQSLYGFPPYTDSNPYTRFGFPYTGQIAYAGFNPHTRFGIPYTGQIPYAGFIPYTGFGISHTGETPDTGFGMPCTGKIRTWVKIRIRVSAFLLRIGILRRDKSIGGLGQMGHSGIGRASERTGKAR